MAGRGPAPKDERSRKRDTRRSAGNRIELVHDRGVHGPELPDSWEWPDETRAWWQVWRESAQAQLFTAVDWSYLLDTARLHAEFWQGAHYLEAGLRLRVAKFGATPEDRQRLRMTIGEPTVAATKSRSTARDRRRLLAAVDDTKPSA